MLFGGTPEQTAAETSRILFSKDANILAEVGSTDCSEAFLLISFLLSSFIILDSS